MFPSVNRSRYNNHCNAVKHYHNRYYRCSNRLNNHYNRKTRYDRCKNDYNRKRKEKRKSCNELAVLKPGVGGSRTTFLLHFLPPSHMQLSRVFLWQKEASNLC